MNEVPPSILAPVKALYTNTIELRHALVHRKTEVGPDGSLIGHTNAGTPLQPVSMLEQVHTCELAPWLALAIERGSLTSREQRRCLALLAALARVHGVNIANPPRLGDIALVRCEIDSTMVIDLQRIRVRAGKDHFGMDLQVVTPGGRFSPARSTTCPTK